MKNPHISITKLDAAKRQLETAIRLYFNEADPISIHTLTCAAHTIIADLNKKIKGTPMVVSDAWVTGKFKKRIKAAFAKPQNFFKHADKDPDAVLKFHPEVTEIYLYDACSKYQELTAESVDQFKIFQGWYMSNNPDYFEFPGKENFLKLSKQFGMGKREFYSNMLSNIGHLF